MRVTRSKLLFLGLALMMVAFGCGGPPPKDAAPADQAGIPELNDEVINDRINEAWIREVPEETGIAAPISWNFDRDEPKEIKVVDKQVNGARATIVLDIVTSSSPRARANRRLAGQIKTEWQLETGWVLRQWRIVRSENISMKYKDIPKPGAENSNLPGDPPLPPNVNAGKAANNSAVNSR